MQQDIVPMSAGQLVAKEAHEKFVTMRLENQLFGLPVGVVQDILRKQEITIIPLSSSEIAGTLNLRGRIVTVIDMHHRLSLSTRPDPDKHMHIVVEYGDELFSLIVDSVGEVLDLPESQLDNAPANLAPNWAAIAGGVYPLEEELLVVLDTEKLFSAFEE